MICEDSGWEHPLHDLSVLCHPSADTAGEDITSEELALPEDEFAMALGSLLRGRNEGIPAIKLSRKVRSRFEALRTNGILDRRYRVYRASHVALL